jgi:vacuolar protein sorting-associated protein VTA1
MASKIKFAKYHALRIAKALKNGEDPNLSNPVSEPEGGDALPLDPNDPEVRAIEGLQPLEKNNLSSRQPTVEEIPDEHDRTSARLAQTSTSGQSLHPSRAPSVPRLHDEQVVPHPQNPLADNYYSNATGGDVSPLEPAKNERVGSIGGGYFPSTSNNVSPTMETPTDPNARDIGRPSEAILPPASPNPATSQPHAQSHNTYSPQQHANQTHPSFAQQQPVLPIYTSFPKSTPLVPPQSTPPVVVDDEAILKAQKHAKWAISALNFEDVPTAIKEFRGALAVLGAL